MLFLRTIILPEFLAPSLVRQTGNQSTLLVRRHINKPAFRNATGELYKPVSLAPSRAPAVRRDKADPSGDIFNTTILRINQALEAHNIEIMWEYWQYLDQKRLLRLLGHVQLKRISTLLANSFCPVGHPEKPWSNLERMVMEEIALVAATHRATDALNSCMLVHLHRNDPEAVLVLYRRFMNLVAKSDSEDVIGLSSSDTEEVEGAVAYDDLASATYSNTDSTPYRPGRAALLLCAITAHAMQDSFVEALETCLSTVVRIQHHATATFFANLRGDRSFKQKLESYIARLRMATLVANPTELSKRINSLVSSRATRSIERLYMNIMDGISGLRPFITVDESAKSKDTPVVFTEVGWTSFLVAFLKCGRKDLASKMWDDMVGLGVRPGISTWTAYIDACDKASAYTEAEAGWTMMLEQGLVPAPLTYRALISAQFNAHSPDKALETFNSFLFNIKQPPMKENLVVHNTILHGLLTNGRLDEAINVFQRMVKDGPKPDVVSYNTFLRYWSRTGDFKMLASVINDMASAGVQGDVFSFSTILSALLKVGRDDAPDLMISLMRKHGVEPNVAIYSAIMDQQLREQTIVSLRIAMRLLQRMELDPNSLPNEVTYTSFLAGIYRGSWLPPTVAEDWRKNIVDRMKRRGIKLNRVTYHILIKACLEYPEPEGINNALAYYREMVREKIQPISITWYILLSGLLRRGEVRLANDVISDITKSGFQPTGAVAELMYKTRKRISMHVNSN